MVKLYSRIILRQCVGCLLKWYQWRNRFFYQLQFLLLFNFFKLCLQLFDYTNYLLDILLHLLDIFLLLSLLSLLR